LTMRHQEKSSNRSPSARWLGALAVAASALALVAAPIIRRLRDRWAITHPRARSEAAIDDALRATYPASDPPATRYFDIPANRR